MLEYLPGTSFLHRLDIRIKLTILFFFVTSILLFNHPLFLGSFAMLATIIFIFCNAPFSHLWKMIAPILPLLVFIILFSGFTYTPNTFQASWSKEIVFYAWPGNHLPYTLGGFFFGVTLSFRIYTMVVLSTIMILTTPMDDFLLVMRKLRFPKPLTFIFVTGIRFIPTMQKKAQLVLAAQKARGAIFHTNNPIGSVIAYIPVMVPLIVESLRMSENLAISMLNRGYGASPQWTALKKLHITIFDVAVLCISCLIFCGVLYMRVQRYGII